MLNAMMLLDKILAFSQDIDTCCGNALVASVANLERADAANVTVDLLSRHH